MLDTYEQHSKRKLIATLLSVVVIAGVIVFADHLKSEVAANTSLSQSTTTSAPATTSPTPANTNTSTSTSTAATTNTSGYADGTYSASSSYYVPHSNENIQVTVSIKDGVIISSSIVNSQGDRDSAAYQQDFASVYKSYVVGKKISSLRLGTIAGASDTTQGFADALSQIASKAQA